MPRRTWYKSRWREVVAAVCSLLSFNIKLWITGLVGILGFVTPPQTTLGLVTSTLTVVTIRRHLPQITQRCVSLCLAHSADTDKTKLSCLVRVGCVNWTGDKTRQFCLVLSCPSFQFEFCLVLTQFPICNCSASNILRTTENLEIGNWVETRQKCLVLSPIPFTPPTRTRQDSFVMMGNLNKV